MIYERLCMCIYIYVCVYIYVCIYVYTYMYVYVYIQKVEELMLSEHVAWKCWTSYS